ncbi:MAG: cardiolipin synthase [Clostridia bacterium]|nr:cardiolipin synthase [Clostridia bacterium]
MKHRIRGLWRVLFGRTTIFVLLILIQIAIIFGGVAVLGTKILIANNIIGVLSVIILIYILNIRQNTSFKLMWIILIVATPVIGVPFYIYTKIQPGTKHIANRLEKEYEEQKNLLLPDKGTVDRLMVDSGNEYGIFKYLFEEGRFPVYDDCGLEYFPLGEDKFDELVRQLQKAEEFIFLEYFIIAKGEMWDQILNILREKVREGVEVRLLYDGTNMMLTLPKGYPKKIRSYGIKCRVFSPMRPFLTTHQNNRDHRKIAVIDGHTAFTGGVNLADEYINRKERFGHWKDTAIMVKGPAVDSFTLMFLQMWNINSSKPEDYQKYMYKGMEEDNSVTYGGYIVPYGDSPLYNEDVGKKVYLDILNRANHYVHIMTPYLILDEEMTNALVFAAQRGIDVKIILPHIPDKKYAYFLARTHYEELIQGGVKLYEYTPGFVHAKVFTSDDEKAVVGTINLDFRSLFLHFECATYIWDNPIVADIEEDFGETLEKCQRITMKNCRDYSLVGKVCGRALRLIAPLM